MDNLLAYAADDEDVEDISHDKGRDENLSAMEESSISSSVIQLTTGAGTPTLAATNTFTTALHTSHAVSTPKTESVSTAAVDTPSKTTSTDTTVNTLITAADTPTLAAAGTPLKAAGTPIEAADTTTAANGSPRAAAGTPNLTATGSPVAATSIEGSATAPVNTSRPGSAELGASKSGEVKDIIHYEDDDMMLDDELKDSDDEESARRTTTSSEATKPPVVMKRTVTATRLVSYGADDVDDDDDADSDTEGGASGEEVGGVSGLAAGLVEVDSMTNKQLNESLSSIRHSISEDEVQLPPEPPGKCSIKLQDKVAKLYARVIRTGIDLNASIQRRKDFRNPSIYEKLVDFCQIDEKGTNYPPELYNPSIWGPESNYEYLAKQQKAEMDRKERERKEKQMKDKGLTVERIVATKKASSCTSGSAMSSGLSPEAKKRSKWDNVGAQIPAMGPISKAKQ